MKIIANHVSVGNVIEHQGKLFVVAKKSTTQPGKGGAYVQLELKNLTEGTKHNERFRSSESIERVVLDEQTYQFLYNEGENAVLMNMEDFEQITVPLENIGESAAFLEEGMQVTAVSHEDNIVSVSLPEEMVGEIVEAEPALKGQTVSSSYKPARLANGVRVMVPPFIDIGTRIIVKTLDASYVKRAE
ncbi:MAG: elongation factor P [Rickettsiales bacterium]